MERTRHFEWQGFGNGGHIMMDGTSGMMGGMGLIGILVIPVLIIAATLS
jgi:hypothetical protein